MLRSILPVCLAALISGFALTPSVRSQEVSGSSTSQIIPFTLAYGFLVVVDVQVGNLKGLKFIVDTGTTRTLIDRRVADRLGLPRDTGIVVNFNRRIPVEWANIPELRVGQMRIASIRATVASLADFSEFAKQADGIIGLDLLMRGSKLTIDYERGYLCFQRTLDQASEISSAKGFVIPLIVQGFPIYLLVDTGLQDIVLYGDHLRKGLPRMRTQGLSIDVTMGRVHASRVRLPGVRITGPEIITNVLLIEGPGGDVLHEVDGFIGPVALRAKRVEFDFQASSFRWQ